MAVNLYQRWTERGSKNNYYPKRMSSIEIVYVHLLVRLGWHIWSMWDLIDLTYDFLRVLINLSKLNTVFLSFCQSLSKKSPDKHLHQFFFHWIPIQNLTWFPELLFKPYNIYFKKLFAYVLSIKLLKTYPLSVKFSLVNLSNKTYKHWFLNYSHLKWENLLHIQKIHWLPLLVTGSL